ncbi:Kiwa anti-phage protein KwaB-like domain-containing protein [Bacillus sp. REN10]|uniref:Kiwa anti-phage protein KwaB-like domain-containing protein n=1 Tax=Bacillus sp. REN10 TaxID=2782541 RepID=UPI00193B19D3|nr:Kiwa anti-phage protein KwaB-like domain-containing protein [Bacillus sp. REN10]
MAAIIDVDNLLELLNDPDIDPITNLYMITRKKDENAFIYNVLTAETLNEVADELNEIFRNNLTKIKSQNKEFRYYDIDDSSNEYVQYINQGDVATASKIMVPIKNNNAEVFTSNTETFNNLWAYAVKIEFEDNKLVWFRKYSKGKVLKKGFKDAVLFKDGKFSKVEHDVFQIDGSVDCFAWNEEIYISQHHNFEKIFSYEDQYEAKVDEALETFKETFTYIDHQSLQTYIETDSMQKRKLAAIIKNGVFEKYGFDEVATTIEKYELGIEIDEQEQKINLSQKDSRRFLKILNDDYLRSEVTKIRYESIAKRKGRR